MCWRDLAHVRLEDALSWILREGSIRRFLEGEAGLPRVEELYPRWYIYGGVIVMVGLRVDVSLSACEMWASGSSWLSMCWWAMGDDLLGAEGLMRSSAPDALDDAGPDEGSAD